jgi:hypothetical protein
MQIITSYIIPKWFAGFSIIMEILFGIVSALVSAFAYKIYKISNEKNIRMFSIGFLFIFISYVLRGIINLFIVSQLTGDVRTINLDHLQSAALIGVYLHMAFFIIGLITIFYANIKTNKKESYFLMLGLGLLSVFTYIGYIAAFHLTAVLLLLFINYHYAKDYIKNKNHRTLLVFMAFILLLLSHAAYLTPDIEIQVYVISHFLELIAYFLILFSLLRAAKIKTFRKIP